MRYTIHFILSILTISFSTAQCPEGMITSNQNLVKNGDFEEGNKGFQSEYYENKLAGARHYRITNDSYKFSPKYFKGKGQGNFMAVDGANGSNIVVWKQEVTVQPNTTYFFSCWTNTLNIKTGPPAVLQFSINNNLLGVPFHCPNSLNKWEQFFVNWSSGNSTKAVITIVSQNPDWDGNDFGLDRIKFYTCEKVDWSKLLNPPINTLSDTSKPHINTNDIFTLQDIQFEPGTSTLLPSSEKTLKELTSYLMKYPNVQIELSVHLDNTIESNSSKKLSQDRADVIRNYLIHGGVKSNNIIATGQGSALPIDSNETMESRQKNRRVEIKILKI